jgi:hypothetical protein
MGNYLNKLKSNSSTASGSGDDDPDSTSSIVQALTIALIGMVALSAASVPALAGSATSVTANDFTEGDSQQTATVNGLSLNSSEPTQFNISASGVDYSSVTTDNITISGANMTVQGIVTAADGQLTFDVTADENISSADVTFYIDGDAITVNSDGTDGTYTVDPGVDGTTVSDSFSYSLASPATGTAEFGNYSTYDNGSVDSVDIRINNASGDLVVDQSNVTDLSNWSAQLETGDYTYTLVADGYADAEGSFTVSENSTTELNPEFGPVSVDYDFTIEQGGDGLSNFTFNIYEGDSIGENETPLSSAESDVVGGNPISVSNLDDGSDYTVEIVYNDSDGNETTYTETITVDSADAENGTVSQTVDVASDSSSDDGGFIGGLPSVDNPFSGVWDSITDQLPTDDTEGLIVTFVGGFVVVVGSLFALFWVLIGLRANTPF